VHEGEEVKVNRTVLPMLRRTKTLTLSNKTYPPIPFVAPGPGVWGNRKGGEGCEENLSLKGCYQTTVGPQIQITIPPRDFYIILVHDMCVMRGERREGAPFQRRQITLGSMHHITVNRNTFTLFILYQ